MEYENFKKINVIYKTNRSNKFLVNMIFVKMQETDAFGLYKLNLFVQVSLLLAYRQS